VTLSGKGSVKACTINGTSVQFHIKTEAEFDRIGRIGSISEEPILKDILSNINPNSNFFDIGANIGIYTCFVSSKLKSGSVHAFEPDQNNLNRLRENLNINKFTTPVHTYDYALSDETGLQELFLEGSGAPGEGSHSIVSNMNRSRGVEIQTHEGDELVGHDLPAPDYMKIDVEGAEYNVLRGLSDTIQRERPIIYCEVHEELLQDQGYSTDQLIEYLHGFGYTDEKLYERNKGNTFYKFK